MAGERPPRPEHYGLDSRTTVLQVLTEFLGPPPVTLRPEPVTRADGTEAIGEELDFLSVRIARGLAFRWAAGERANEVPVRKTWRKLDGRDFLIEEVPVRDVADELDRLPAPTGAVRSPGAHAIPRTASLHLPLPPAPRTARVATTEPMLLARYTPPDRAFVLDYQALNSTLTNVTFQADTTYYVSGRVDLYGTTTFEGGTVVKTADVSSGALWVNGPMQWDTGLYRPAVFSSKNDDSLGETIPGSTGNPQRQQHVALVTAQSGTVRGARFLYARTAICPLASLGGRGRAVGQLRQRGGRLRSARDAAQWTVRQRRHPGRWQSLRPDRHRGTPDRRRLRRAGEPGNR
jgi:hypothetical protein